MKISMCRCFAFAAAAEIAGVRRAVVKDQPNVGLTEHRLAGGRAIVVAVNYNDFPVVCAIAHKGRVGKVYRGNVGNVSIDFLANDFAVFELHD